ncbi:helix-turn-helix transcriptional regulator [Enterococcus sp.]|uniref:helix-turn-helix domain-containing protein n=1 Tax=Enterococcus sp. TaxID=35783 RepID=UPI000ED1D111|nr:helix-turn-helix transcriptional regulator [Enterococcus sp.]HCM86850.1 XRE family transcriptional regulator [Enterococcus sp.]
MKQYSRLIKQKRKERGLTQKELAKIVHTSQQAIARYETQKAEPSLEVLQAISEALGTPLSYFIDEDTSETEKEYIALYRSLSEENQNKALEFLRLLKRQEIEQIYFTENKIYPKKDTAFQYDKNVIESFLKGLYKED